MNRSPENNLLGVGTSSGRVVLALLLCAAGFAAYAPSLHAPFVFDDERTILRNPAIEYFWPTDVRSSLGRRRPVGHMTLAINYALGGSSPTGYHVFNLAVHLSAGLLLFGLVRRTLLLPRLRGSYAESASRLAFAVALIWLVHPLATQGVTYIIQRCESMMAMFYLACLVCVLRGSQSLRPASWAWYTAALTALSLGMGTKEVMFTAPVVIILFDRVFLSETWRDVFRRRWGFYGLCLIPMVRLGMAVSPAMKPGGKPGTIGFHNPLMSSWDYLSSQPGVILHYLRLSFWPHPQSLDYAWRVADDKVSIYVLGAVVVGLVLASFWALRYRPTVGFVGLAFFIVLAPTSSFVPYSDLAFEHRMYLPLVAVVVLAVFGFHTLAGRFLPNERTRTMVSTAVLLLVAGALLAGTIRRNEQYNHPIEMWQDVVANAPHNARAFTILAGEYRKRGEFDAAIENFEKSIRIEPNANTYHQLGNLYKQKKDIVTAEKYYRLAISIRPDFAESYVELGRIRQDQGQLEEAEALLRKAVELKPKLFRAVAVLGLVLEAREKLDDAVEQYLRALELEPRNAQVHLQLGIVRQSQGKHSEATAHYERSLEIDPSQDSLREFLRDYKQQPQSGGVSP